MNKLLRSNSMNHKTNSTDLTESKREYSWEDAITIPEELRATSNFFSQQHEHNQVAKKRKMLSENGTNVLYPNEIGITPNLANPLRHHEEKIVQNSYQFQPGGYQITNVLKNVYVPKQNYDEKQMGRERKRRSWKGRNAYLIERNRIKREREDRYMSALNEGITLWNQTKHTREQLKTNPNYKGYNESISTIIRKVNSKLQNDDKTVTKTTLLRYAKKGIETRKSPGPARKLPFVLLNTMRLHIKVLQLSEQGQASGSMIKRKLLEATKGTEFEKFDANAAWKLIREIWPEEIAPEVPTTVLPRNLSDDAITDMESGIRETYVTALFDNETGVPKRTAVDKGGSRAVRWGDPNRNGTSAHDNLKILEEYETSKVQLEAEGFNVAGIFDATISNIMINV